MSVPTVFQDPGRNSPDELDAVAADLGKSAATVLVVNDVANDTLKVYLAATSLIREINSSVAFSDVHLSLITRLMAFAQTFSLFKFVNL
jgi:hypothetical protein